VFRSCPNPPENFPDFSEIYSHFLLSYFYLEGSKNLFHEHQILYLDFSCLNLALGIFLEFLEFFKYFSCSKNIFWCLLELFSH
jgi:hypothetical protein